MEKLERFDMVGLLLASVEFLGGLYLFLHTWLFCRHLPIMQSSIAVAISCWLVGIILVWQVVDHYKLYCRIDDERKSRSRHRSEDY